MYLAQQLMLQIPHPTQKLSRHLRKRLTSLILQTAATPQVSDAGQDLQTAAEEPLGPGDAEAP